jgi:hypothetical protein
MSMTVAGTLLTLATIVLLAAVLWQTLRRLAG